MNATELLATKYEPLQWLVKDVIPQGQLVLIGGKPKASKKSKTVFELALAATDGGTWLNLFQFGGPDGKGQPTLFIGNQDNARRLQERMQQLSLKREREPKLRSGGPRKPRPNDLLEIETEWPTYAQGGLQKIEKWLQFHKGRPTVVIIDVLAKFRRIPGGYNVDSEVLEELAEFAHKYNVTLVGVVHFYKGVIRPDQDFMDKFQGSAGVSASIDVGIGIDAVKQTAKECRLLMTGKDIEARTFKLVLNDAGFWEASEISEEEEAQIGKELSPERQLLLKTVTAHAGEAAPEIWRLQPTNPKGEPWKSNAVRQTLYQMAKDGQLVNDDGDFYTLQQWKERQGQRELWEPGSMPVERPTVMAAPQLTVVEGGRSTKNGKH